MRARAPPAADTPSPRTACGSRACSARAPSPPGRVRRRAGRERGKSALPKYSRDVTLVALVALAALAVAAWSLVRLSRLPAAPPPPAEDRSFVNLRAGDVVITPDGDWLVDARSE